MKSPLTLAIFTGLLSSTAVSQATVNQTVIDTIAGCWVGQQSKETLLFLNDGTYQATYSRQVGGNDPEVPYPTVCSYTQSGRVLSVAPPTPNEAAPYTAANAEVPSVVIAMSIESVSLIPSADMPAACVNYLVKTKKRISDLSEGEYVFLTVGMKPSENGTLTNTWDKEIFVRNK